MLQILSALRLGLPLGIAEHLIDNRPDDALILFDDAVRDHLKKLSDGALIGPRQDPFPDCVRGVVIQIALPVVLNVESDPRASSKPGSGQCFQGLSSIFSTVALVAAAGCDLYSLFFFSINSSGSLSLMDMRITSFSK